MKTAPRFVAFDFHSVRIRLTVSAALRLDRGAAGRPRILLTDRPDDLETTMLPLRRRTSCCFLFAFLVGSLLPAAASDIKFPFGSALLLDAAPAPGSKRIPMIEIDENGTAAFNLWCSNVRGSANVADNTITIAPTTALPAQCTPDRLSRDVDLLAALSQVTSWRRQGDIVDLFGTTNLRFRLMTN